MFAIRRERRMRIKPISLIEKSTRHHVHADVVHDPQRTDDHDQDRQHREAKCRHVPALARRRVHVQEEHEMDHDLHHSQHGEAEQRGFTREAAVQHEPERSGREHHRQDETCHVASYAAMAFFFMDGMSTHLDHARKINKGEHANPDDVQEVPEEAQAREAADFALAQHRRLQRLNHEDDHPDHAHRHVDTVGGDQREERRQEGAALRAVALGDHVRELMQFEVQERRAQQEGDRQPDQHLTLALLVRADHGETVGDGRQQQHCRFHRHALDVEQILTRRAACELILHHGEHCEQRAEQNTVGHQVQPETEHRV
ncbi:conserved hypothetical protein [Paraburkholderia tropica]